MAGSSGNAVVGSRRRARQREQHNTCVNQTISPERKHLYAKALVVWLLFTVAGSLSIPDQFVPMFSHCVGFGFFLTITTHRIRWLGVIAVVGVVLTIVLYGTIPEEWILVATNSAGYTVLGTMVVLVSLWRVAPNDLKEEIIQARDGMVNRGSAYFEELRARYMMSGSAPTPNSHEDERASELLAGVDRSHYCRIVVKLDSKLVELEKEIESMKTSFAATSKKMSQRLATEMGERVQAQNALATKTAEVQRLTAKIQSLEKAAECDRMTRIQRKLREERERSGELSQMQRKLAHDLEVEKGTRLMVERQCAKAEEERARLRRLLESKQRNGRLTEQNVAEISKALSNEAGLRAAAVKESQMHKRNMESAREELEKVQNELAEVRTANDIRTREHEQQYANLQAELALVKEDVQLLKGKNLTNLNSAELQQLQNRMEEAVQTVVRRRVQVLHDEQERLMQKNEELQDKMLCRVCLSHERSVLLVPCGHVCLCRRCALQLSDCPLCRERIQERRDVFVC